MALCPITQPPKPAFVPPAPFRPIEGVAPFTFYYGTPQLFTRLNRESRTGVPARNGNVRIKWPWFSSDLSSAEASSGKALLSLSARRLDANAVAVVVAGPKIARSDVFFYSSTLEFPSDGCWEITGKRKEAVVSFVVWIRR